MTVDQSGERFVTSVWGWVRLGTPPSMLTSVRLGRVPGLIEPTGRLRVVTPADTSEVSSLRREIRAFIERHGHDDVAAEIELVVSELATNVIDHTGSDDIVIMIDRDEHRWTVDVADAENVPRLADIVDPTFDTLSGRGLIIVRALMDSVEVRELEDAHVIRCRRSADTAGS